ncbi:Stk1 family PASTA domain-containing Ser/Thr kinase [Actinoalloteichus caeruleus]|uniref:non-specific serine/threonine protein kinase n=1 Tax=Actinoalloteichus caeruleus DSM 43889 TaxID=1120930 RepID=A0ABT1JI58_ACTCY|nr:PASTA domain-containing protein [Actinoalloteichus caeruleus]MCP2331858.1 serine/threonine protein kinase [Actinoalloteichus caeruleus DSM 43889]
MNQRGVDLTGATLEGRYRVESVLARGGMSVVYRGVDTRLERPVAIKVMDHRFSADRTFVERFVREARAAARLHHPAIVSVHDQGVDHSPTEDHVFLVMELVDGGTLRELLRQDGELPVPLALSVLEPVLSALGAAHGAGMVHRDVKPENILIGPNDAVKVADFGLVRAVSDAKLTSDSTILGTVAYLSPEQVETGVTDSRGDVYSAGIVLYEMLTGRPPYTGDSPLSVAYRHVNSDVPPPSEAVPGIPPALDELVLRATSRDPARRPADATAFRDELLRVRDALGVRRVPVPVPTAVWTPPPTTSTATPSSDGGAPPSPDGPPTERIPVTPPAGQHTQPGPPPPPHPGPAGGGPIGPQGTRALSRDEYASGQYGRPHGAEHAGHPTAPPTPPGGQRRGPVQDPYSTQRRRSRRSFVIWMAIVTVLALVIGVTAWWFGSGRWTSVPDLRGMSHADAVAALEEADLVPSLDHQFHDSVELGQVFDTGPEGGAEALRGSRVRVLVSKGLPVVPEVAVGISLDEANELVEDARLTPVRDEGLDQFSEEIAAGDVLGLDPEAGTEMAIGGEVRVVLSKGPPPVPVPDVTGQTRDEAVDTLTSAGFEPDVREEFAEGVEAGRVIRTSPDPGTEMLLGEDNRVEVVVSNAVQVPDVTGRRVDEARRDLEDADFAVEVDSWFGEERGRVFGQSPPGGAWVEPGSTVTLNNFPIF